MIKEVLQSIANIEIFPVISMILFFASFLAILIYVLRLDRDTAGRFGRLPLDDAGVADKHHGSNKIIENRGD